jgi:hypothetical protein
MGFTVKPCHPDSYLNGDMENLRQFELKARCAIYIEPMAFANIPHGVELVTDGTPVMLLGDKGCLVDKSLVIGHSQLGDGEVWTPVFNLSNKARRINKGEVISSLVGL